MENPQFAVFPELETLIATEPDSIFFVPDVALVEMCKHEQWRRTMGLSFALFVPATKRTYASLSVGIVLQLEIQQRRPIEAQEFISHDFTPVLRDLIAEFGAKREGDAMRLVAEHFVESRSELLLEELNAESAKQRTGDLAAILCGALKPAVLKVFRTKRLDATARLDFILVNAQQFCQEYLIRCGFREEQAKQMISANALVLRYFFVLVRHVLKWSIQCGWDNVRADKELNNQLDQEYVLTASYFDRFLSNDKAARDAYDDLLQLMARSFEDQGEIQRRLLAALNQVQ
jgi:hypothetical protein